MMGYMAAANFVMAGQSFLITNSLGHTQEPPIADTLLREMYSCIFRGDTPPVGQN